MRPTSNTPSTALILSHPGHELRVLGWLKTARPLVLILTDGSGHTTQPRIELSCELIEGAGGRLGSLCGNFTDQQFYQAILNQDLDFFTQLRTRICDILAEQQIDLVVGDSIEGAIRVADELARAQASLCQNYLSLPWPTPKSFPNLLSCIEKVILL